MSSTPYEPGQLASLFGTSDANKVFHNQLNDPEIPAILATKHKRGREKRKEDIEAKKLKKKSKNEEEKRVVEEGESKDARTLFVGSVPISTPKAALKLLKQSFQQFGPIESLRLRSVPIAPTAIPSGGTYKTMRKVSVIQNKLENASCNAYIVFKQSESVEKAVSTGMEVSGKKLRLDAVVAARNHINKETDKNLFDRTRTVFIGNLPFDATETDVTNIFQNSDVRVEDVRLIRNREDNTGKGFGYVLLETADMMDAALALNGETLNKREIRVTRCQRIKNIGATTKGNFVGTKAVFDGKKFASMRLKKKGIKKNKKKQ